MHDPSLEKLFARFHASGDPAALAAIFDQTAPELLRVSRHLARDGATAEDLVQETFLAAMAGSAGFDPSRQLLPWLLGILANQARLARRRETRNLPREENLLPTESLPTEEAENKEAASLLKRAIAKLPEPYGRVLTLHLQEDLEPSQLAQRLKRPASTVRTQIQRGLDLLRQALPAGVAPAIVAVRTRGLDGVREALLARAGTLPIRGTVNTATTITATIGTLLMKKLLLTVMALVIIGTGAFLVIDTDQNGDPTRVSSEIGKTNRATPLKTPDSLTNREGQRRETLVIPEPPLPPTEPTTEANPIEIAGVVRDPAGNPLAGVPIYFTSDQLYDSDLTAAAGSVARRLPALAKTGHPPFLPSRPPLTTKMIGQVPDLPDLNDYPARLLVAVSDGSGCFAVHQPRIFSSGDLRTAGKFTTIRSWPLAGNEQNAIILVAPNLTVQGIVRDQAGRPLKNVLVSVQRTELPHFPYSLDRTRFRQFQPDTFTDEHGRFRLLEVPHLTTPATLVFFKTGFFQVKLAAKEEELQVRLKQCTRYLVTGTVLRQGGQGMAGAIVGFGRNRCRTGPEGSFRLEFRSPRRDQDLWAMKAGWQPVRLRDFAKRLKSEPTIQDLQLLLHQETLSLAGRVIDQQKKPVPNLRVTLADPTWIGTSGEYTETFSAPPSKQVDPSGQLRRKTDQNGSFRLGGLFGRPYRLRLYHQKHHYVYITDPLRAGRQDLVITIPAKVFREQVDGHVLNNFGAPVPGAKVRINLWISKTPTGSGISVGQIPVSTDEKGRFVIKKAPRYGADLQINGPGIEPYTMALPPEQPARNLLVKVDATGQFRLTDKIRSAITHIKVLDANNIPLSVRVKMANSGGSATSKNLCINNLENLFSTSSRACTLVLQKKGKEIGHHPLSLEPGKIVVVP